MINFSGKELEVIRFIAQGFSKKEIASKLNISYHTVKSILENIYLKTGVHNKVQLVVYLFKNNFDLNI